MAYQTMKEMSSPGQRSPERPKCMSAADGDEGQSQPNRGDELVLERRPPGLAAKESESGQRGQG